MKRLAITTALAFALGTVAPAAEVYFDTVSTAKATRLHGSYISAYAGGSRIGGVSTGKNLRGHSLNNATGWNAGVRFGYSFDTPVALRPALELDLGYLSNDVSLRKSADTRYKGGLQSVYAFGNVLLALDLENTGASDFWSKLKPYVGAGAGLAYARVRHLDYVKDGRRVDDEDGGQISFGYQVFAGLEYEFTDQFSIYGEYKYLSLYDLGGGDVQGADFSQYLVGMKFQY
ncbi:MAG: outer membrane beta-barrel protein [Verrucomicrobiaceae bacterium]|nr:outer membrane beta-barrel protein [Verrucomicrobiaceae bacterium]